jgi:hypothetical protein
MLFASCKTKEVNSYSKLKKHLESIAYMINEQEIWKDIPGYEGLYQASSLGRIRSVDRMKKDTIGRFRVFPSCIIKPLIQVAGYSQVNLYKNSVTITRRVNRLVALTFLPNPEGKPQVNHLDGNKENNSVGNLEWATASENVAHSYNTGLRTGRRGESSNLSKLKRSDVDAIRAAHGTPQKRLADKYQVSVSTISMIINNKIWAY